MKTQSYLERRGIDRDDFAQELALASLIHPNKTEAELRTIALRNCLRLISGGKRQRQPSEALPDFRDTPPAIAEDSPELYEVWEGMPFKTMVASAMEDDSVDLPPMVRKMAKNHLEATCNKPRPDDFGLKAMAWRLLTFGTLCNWVKSGRRAPQYMPRGEVRSFALATHPMTSRDRIDLMTARS